MGFFFGMANGCQVPEDFVVRAKKRAGGATVQEYNTGS
jgi:hypothetical protein